MLESSRTRILASLSHDAVVLDVGGWGSPFSRADWVIDLMPYETRGLYGEPSADPERFSAETWVTRDICDREPWPFEDDRFDYVICSHTLEDVRDPIWVCAEMNRVARAGYLEVPSRVEEQTRGVHGPWVGWSHHHWLVDVEENHVGFVLKPHLLHGRPEFWIDPDYTRGLPPEGLVSTMFWTDGFAFSERVFYEPDDLHAYLRALVDKTGHPARVPGGGKASYIDRALRRLLGRS